MTPTRFFAAANTESGFVSLFDEIFSPKKLSRIYILKGGPGTGKSTLMKHIGFAAEAGGEQVEYAYCSSDTDSLDGIILKERRIAILDGTAPHTTDPLYPGAVERIVNLGDAFDAAGLEKESEILRLLAEKKHRCYRCAYRYLGAAGALMRQIDETAGEAFLYVKARGAAERLTLGFSGAEKGEIIRRYLSAIGTKGVVTLDTFMKKAKRRIAITNKFGLGYTFMNIVYASLAHMGIAMTVCSAPPVSSHIECLYITGEDVLIHVTTEDTEADKTVNILRFVDKDTLAKCRPTLRRLEKGVEMLMEGALTSLREVGAFHASAEAVYGKYVDFSKVDIMRNRLMNEIFANNM